MRTSLIPYSSHSNYIVHAQVFKHVSMLKVLSFGVRQVPLKYRIHLIWTFFSAHCHYSLVFNWKMDMTSVFNENVFKREQCYTSVIAHFDHVHFVSLKQFHNVYIWLSSLASSFLRCCAIVYLHARCMMLRFQLTVDEHPMPTPSFPSHFAEVGRETLNWNRPLHR